MRSIKDKMEEPGGFTTGFDYLRIGLSVAVLGWHTIFLSTGSWELDASYWSSPWRFLPAALLPMFFALSGFLVTGSLLRVRLHQFIVLRLVRLVPALAVEVVLSALLLGVIFTALPIGEYLRSPELHVYFLNIVGLVHFKLPGVFLDNPEPGMINAQLWTIPFEFECYAAIVLLSIARIIRTRLVFLFALVILGGALTTAGVVIGNVQGDAHLPGRALVMAFLVAIALYLYRDRIPFSNALGVASLIISAILLDFPNCVFIAVVPLAYVTVWLGLMRPPRIPFGDLSYGVYLFHYPIEQMLVHLFPALRTPALLTLAALPLTGLCAWLSWNLIEQPTLSRKKQILRWSDRAYEAVVGRFVAKVPPKLFAGVSEPAPPEQRQTS